MQGYDQLEIKVIRSTEAPGSVCKLACNHTMVAEPEEGLNASPKLLKFLVRAEHTSVFEHCAITFMISGVSRSLMAQLTRSRMSSITCQSQHYQDYEDVPTIVDPALLGDLVMSGALDNAYRAYEILREFGTAKEEARQVLPNAAAVNILWTVNARELMLFLRQRLCKRNVLEMRIFAECIRVSANLWWPELFTLSGAPCVMDGKCNQGHMRSALCK